MIKQISQIYSRIIVITASLENFLDHFQTVNAVTFYQEN